MESEETSVISLSVNLSLSPKFMSLVAPDDLVFLFAKDSSASGPSMPLAAKKMRVGDLPAKITLSDADAMGPMAKLSNAENVTISARVSFSGQPIASSGDLEVTSQVLAVSDMSTHNLEIDTKRP